MSSFPSPGLPQALSTAFSGTMDSFYRNLLDGLSDGVYFVDRELRITYWNRGAEQITGYAAEEVIGKRCSDNLLIHVDEKGRQLCFTGCPLQATLCDNARRRADVYLSHKEGHRVPVNVRVAPIAGPDGTVIGAVEVFTDISAHKQTERRAAEMENMAFRDSLTGIPNRRFAEMKIQHAIQEVERFQRDIALLMIDLNHFKAVNDRHGHATGDALLRAVARTLNDNTRSGATVGRWGGDEFVIVAYDVRPDQLHALAARTGNMIAASAVNRAGHRVGVSAAVGATMILGGDSPESALNRADELMYAAKGRAR